MAHSLVRKKGVPALAYPVNDVSVLRRCYLKILCSDAQFVVSLERSVSIHGSKNLFTLRYEGDNLMPGKTSLRDVDISLPPESLEFIRRQGQPRPRTLSLTLRAPCSVWHPRSLGNGVTSLDTDLYELLTLARATEVRILFDINWLGKHNLASLRSAVEGSGQLTGVSIIPQFARLYQQAEWPIFDFAKDAKFGVYHPTRDLASEAVPSIEGEVAGAPLIEDEVHDAPPSYAYVSSKRRRNTRSSLTPDTRLPKRVFQYPTCATSPTERATSASSLGSKHTPSSTATVEVDIFQETVTSAVKKVLPDMLNEQLPGILHDALSRMLTESSPLPSLSPTPRSSQSANALMQHLQTPRHKPSLIRTVIRTATKIQLERLLDDAVDEAYQQVSELHKSADVEFEEGLDNIRLEFATIKEDQIAACNDDLNERLEGFQESLDEAEAEVKAHADKIVLKTWDRLDMIDKMWHSRKCLCRAKDTQSKLEQGRRAMSLPLSKQRERELLDSNELERHRIFGE